MQRFGIVAVTAAVLAMVGCESDESPDCEAGSSGCSCLPDNTCVGQFRCLSGVCVLPGSRPDGIMGEPSDGGMLDGAPGDGGGDDAGDAQTATPTQCEELAGPESGSVSASGTSPGDVASYACDPTYGLVGVASRTCQPDGTWTDAAPTCAPGDCPSLASPNDGTVTTAGGTARGQSAVYMCNEGRNLVGEDTRTCQDDNTWSREEPLCELVDCGAPDAIDDGIADVSTGTTFGEVAGYSCDPGYQLAGEAMRTCQADGSWSGAVPSCGPVDCGSLSAPDDGSVDVASTTYGATATYGCADGFGVVGQAARTCQVDGTWSGTAPSCAPGDCSTPTAPTDGTVITPTGTTFGSVATYECNVGHNLAGTMTRTCQADKTWSGTLPSCEIVDCGGPAKPSNGSVGTPNGTTYGETATYSCNTGRELSGSSTRTCLASGNWSGSLPTCALVDCGSPPGPGGGPGSVSTPNNATTYQTVATYTCQTGYSVSGSSTRTCQANGDWSGATPSCQLVSCGTPPGPTGGPGSVSTPGNATTYQTVASYTCSTGYSLSGNMTRTCQANGTWSGSRPSCQLVSCGAPPGPGGPGSGSVATPNGTDYQDVATYSCSSGYTLSGGATRSCQASGAWSGSTPSCQPVSCGNPPGPLGPGSGSVSTPGNATTYQTVATYSCNTNYAVVGNKTRTCQASGSWNGSTPSCQLRLEPVPWSIYARAISPDGSVVVGEGTGQIAAKYSGGTVSTLGVFIGDSRSDAYAVSNNGDVIVGMSEWTNLGTGVITTRAVKWVGGIVTELTKPAGAANCRAFDVSSDGTVIVGACINSAGSKQSVVRWLNGTPSDLGTPAGTSWCYDTKVSGDGSKMYGICSVTSSSQPFVGDTGGLSIISSAQAGCWPHAVSTNGSKAVGGCATTGASVKGFVYTSGSGLHVMTGSELLKPAPLVTEVMGISGDGTYFVGHTEDTNNSIYVVVRWQNSTPHRVSDLLSSRSVSIAGWSFSEGVDISEDGSTIIGRGYLNGKESNFIARLQ